MQAETKRVEDSRTRPLDTPACPDTMTFMRQLAEAVGLGEVKGVIDMTFGCKNGIATVTVVRLMTKSQQAAVVATLRQWDCELVVNGPVFDRSVSPDGSASAAGLVSFPSSHPREG